MIWLWCAVKWSSCGGVQVVELFGSDSENCFVAVDEDKSVIGFCLGTTVEKRHSSCESKAAPAAYTVDIAE
jgi:hypothetical protein